MRGRCRNIGVTYEAPSAPFVVGGRDKNLDVSQERNMENLAIVVVFALALVAIVALGRGVRGKFGSIEIATKDDPTHDPKKLDGNVTPPS